MECFSNFWSRRVEEASTSWWSSKHHFEDLLSHEMMASEDLREVLRLKAERHREYFKSLAECDNAGGEVAAPHDEMAPPSALDADLDDATTKEPKRQRRTGVYELKSGSIFKSVKLLRENYIAMLQKTKESFLERDETLLAPPSGYSTGASDDERETKNKVQRCGSSDSAMGHSEDEGWRERQDVKSPYSPRGSIDHDSVPSRTLLESKCVPLPVDRKFSDCASDCDFNDSRRHSVFTDDGEEPRCRYWRTPSVVVSDYSDDIMGLTLEDIEYIRSQRKESSSPDSSLHSSCSNLNYCGSTISSLESEYVLRKPFRKSSNCSTCSTLSDDEGDNLQVKKEMASNGNSIPMPAHPSSRPKSLMESLLVAKMEQVTAGHPKPLVRTDSADSASSMGSVTSTTSDVCRCDDCLLGIADLYAQPVEDSRKKKVRGRHET
ncbi:hypothetical protein TcasGA2_TC031102 [Tribolium castaneum]|uniref:Uncharacterized protein n=1 Tax=Tribolium castaneum TaxID=7070 RepID=A0A139WIT2_TRICA|nr:hypothetical protein TcasGA2_TC031102 [Tribolium castaneum]